MTEKLNPKRNLPPVSKAKGGLRPGIDGKKLSSIMQEMDDLEYAGRMKRGFETISPSPKPPDTR